MPLLVYNNKKLGVGSTSVYNWCNGIKSPRMDKVDVMTTSTPEEFEILIKPYRSLDSHGKELVDFVLTKEAERMKELEIGKDVTTCQCHRNEFIHPKTTGTSRKDSAQN